MTTASFEAAFAFITGASIEGGFGNDPRDRGNWTSGKVGVGALKGTKYGISAASFPLLDIANITLDQAKALYLAHYWVPIQGDGLPADVAFVVFDCAVNQGVHAAIVMLQQAAGASADGWIGPETLAAAKAGTSLDIVLEFCARRGVAYAEAEGMPVDGLGWMRRLFRASSAAQTVKD